MTTLVSSIGRTSVQSSWLNVDEASARLFSCELLECRHLAAVCRSCDRGNIYCSLDCAKQGRRKSLQSAGRRYQSGSKGRVHHAARQAAYLRRQAEKMTHQCSLEANSSVTVERVSGDEEVSPEIKPSLRTNEVGKIRCCCCGSWCGPLLRRSFWRRGRCRVQKQGGKT